MLSLCELWHTSHSVRLSRMLFFSCWIWITGDVSTGKRGRRDQIRFKVSHKTQMTDTKKSSEPPWTLIWELGDCEILSTLETSFFFLRSFWQTKSEISLAGQAAFIIPSEIAKFSGILGIFLVVGNHLSEMMHPKKKRACGQNLEMSIKARKRCVKRSISCWLDQSIYMIVYRR